jgi:hypothetical protein
MTFTTFVDLRINNAEQLKEAVAEPAPNTKIFLTFGKVDAWPDETSPNVSNSSVATAYEIWSNMIGGKRVLGGDVMHVIPRFNWEANTVYTAYDHMNTNLHDGNTCFYVLNSDFSVYKCIANNNGGMSTVEPSTFNTSSPVSASDGYVWKYMYSLNDSEKLRFTTTNYMPVKTLTLDDGSLQWDVQEQAAAGSIEAIFVTSGGQNYMNTANISVTITGDGTLATAIPTLNTSSNTIESFIITNSGSDYTYADVEILDSSGGEAATARAIISPIGGHGSDPLYELGGKNLMFNIKLRYTEEGVLQASNDFRQISLLKDPYLRSTSNVASNATFNQAYTITAFGSGDYNQDEYVYQGGSFATATFSGRVLVWESDTNTLLLINTKGEPTAAQSLIGTESFTVRSINSAVSGDIEKHSGRLLYVDNIKPITRSTDQIEDFRIVMKF